MGKMAAKTQCESDPGDPYERNNQPNMLIGIESRVSAQSLCLCLSPIFTNKKKYIFKKINHENLYYRVSVSTKDFLIARLKTAEDGWRDVLRALAMIDTVVHTFNPSTWRAGGQEDLYESEVSLVHTASSSQGLSRQTSKQTKSELAAFAEDPDWPPQHPHLSVPI